MHSPPKRLATLIKLIANNPGVTLQNVCRLLNEQAAGVSQRTVCKDIASLKHDFELLESSGRLRKGYELLDIVTLGEKETDVVLDALNAFALALDDAEAKQVLDRLQRLVTNRQRSRSQSRTSRRVLGQKVIVDGKSDTGRIEQLIMSALREQQAVRVEYESPRTRGKLKSDAYPLFKIFYERAWYIVIREVKTHRFYPCRLDRIGSVQILPDIPRNDAFLNDVHEARYLISCGWGMTFPSTQQELKNIERMPQTVVRFDATVAPYILEGVKRHPRAEVHRARDGTGDVIFKIRLPDLWEFKHWVRSFGPSAWFVAPESLVEEERAQIRRLAARYNMCLYAQEVGHRHSRIV